MMKTMTNKISHAFGQTLPFLLLSLSLLFFQCKKEDKTPLGANLTGGWYAESVTQSGIDVTPSYQYSFSFEANGSCQTQRVWKGTYAAFICSYNIDEENDVLSVQFTGIDPWQLNWELTESDFGAKILKFRDTDASAETIIVLKSF